MERRDRRINYIEFAVRDIERAKAFYGAAFGWTFTDYGPAYCEFSDGFMTGGFDAGATPDPKGGALVVLYGENLDDIAEAIRAAGGEITIPTFEFPGGQRFHFRDPEGYELAVWKSVEA